MCEPIMMDCFGNFKCRGGGGWVRTIFCGGVANLFLGGEKAKYFGVGCPTLFVLFHNETNAS